MWDNRESKTNPRAPDAKCKDKNCDGVVWPPKKPKKPQEAPRVHNAGPLLPNEEPGYLEALAGQPTPETHPTLSQKAKVEQMYLECLEFVVNKVLPIWTAGDIPCDAGAMNAAVATLMIQRGGR
jgi:hypothetical protein